MPRGVKGSGKPRKTIDERIVEIDETVEKLKNEISDLLAQKRALQKERKNENKNELFKVVAEARLTPDELRDLIEKVKK